MANFYQDIGKIARIKAIEVAVNSFTFTFFQSPVLGSKTPQIRHPHRVPHLILAGVPHLILAAGSAPQTKPAVGGEPATNPRLFYRRCGLSNTRKISICTHARS